MKIFNWFLLVPFYQRGVYRGCLTEISIEGPNFLLKLHMIPKFPYTIICVWFPLFFPLLIIVVSLRQFSFHYFSFFYLICLATSLSFAFCLLYSWVFCLWETTYYCLSTIRVLVLKEYRRGSIRVEKASVCKHSIEKSLLEWKHKWSVISSANTWG